MSSDQRRLRTLRRADFPYFISYHTRWNDNDGHAHLSNSICYHLMDTIFTTWAMENFGIDPKTSPLIAVVVSSWCQIYGPLSFPEVLDVGLRVTKVEKRSFDYQIGIFKKGRDNPSIVGGTTQVVVDQETKKKPSEIDEELRAIFGKLQVEGMSGYKL
ncbi:thioesterase family protein [Moniliophthora roreri MCA 2997]|uniref:Thioesterase family protein n=1 Tax=Moniliophthora roreri (strain MCA 2997) TaxID=1381753 RepID=V2WP99_MONRO|nr:thioesterase family protein [Moniliophthora roreri MCA 2997]